jgi:CheY-like chemotaxis protein
MMCIDAGLRMPVKHILIVEDDIRIADLISLAAEKAGYIVRTAAGQTAIEAACDDGEPDVITLDIHMPDMDGVEVLQYLHTRFSRARIVILSGSDGLSRGITENLGKALGFTIEANLAKPFEMDKVQAVLENIKALLGVVASE